MAESKETSVESRRKQVEAVTLRLVETKGTMGLVVGVICEGEQHTYCAGRLEDGNAVAPDERTLFEIGSITKVLTTTLLADMHLRGEVDLDDPVSKFLPSTLVLESRDGVAVTLRHLATHRSGLPRLPGNLGIKNLTSENPYEKYTVEDLYAYLSKRRLITSPGEFSSYSNLGMGLLGHALALATGKEFEVLMIERVCAPLGMVDTVMTLSEEQRGRLAPGHAKGKQVSNWDIPTLAGCGAFRSTLADMKIFLKAMMNPEGTPLQGALELTQSIQPRKPKARRKIPWRTALPGSFQVWIYAALGVWAGLLVAQGELGTPIALAVLMAVSLAVRLLSRFLPVPDMGLGWFVMPLGESNKNQTRAFWHNGGTGGYRSFLGFEVGRKVGVVLLSNSTTSPDATGQRLLTRLVADVDENA